MPSLYNIINLLKDITKQGMLTLEKTYNKKSSGAVTPRLLQLHAVRFTVTYI